MFFLFLDCQDAQQYAGARMYTLYIPVSLTIKQSHDPAKTDKGMELTEATFLIRSARGDSLRYITVYMPRRKDIREARYSLPGQKTPQTRGKY